MKLDFNKTMDWLVIVGLGSIVVGLILSIALFVAYFAGVVLGRWGLL